MHESAKQNWELYCAEEMKRFTPILAASGYSLDEKQPHLIGERHLMQAVTTEHGRKLVLLGERTSDHKRVVIKISSDPAGMKELIHEKESRTVLHKINFAYQTFHTPIELAFIEKPTHIISIQEFLTQKHPFLELPLATQFSVALQGFKAQESAHATTHKHVRLIQKTFSSFNAKKYIATCGQFVSFAKEHLRDAPELHELLLRAESYLAVHEDIIEQYGNFLTHTDFVPHNFRIVGDSIYLLDHSAIRFGNKYEGWARFLNFMTLYNPPLEQALTAYVAENRASEELLSLKLMRIYRLCELIRYYIGWLPRTSGSLAALAHARITFWSTVLNAVLDGTKIAEETLEKYRALRDTLRDSEEKERQIGLH